MEGMWVETSSGNRISQTASISGSSRILISGNSTISHNVEINGDKPVPANHKHTILIGKYCFFDCNTHICPPMIDEKEGMYGPMRIGSYSMVGRDCKVRCASIGNRVMVEDNVELGNLSIIYDCCVVREGAVVPDRMVIPPFSEVSGTPGINFKVQRIGSGWRKLIETEARERHLLGR